MSQRMMKSLNEHPNFLFIVYQTLYLKEELARKIVENFGLNVRKFPCEIVDLVSILRGLQSIDWYTCNVQMLELNDLNQRPFQNNDIMQCYKQESS